MLQDHLETACIYNITINFCTDAEWHIQLASAPLGYTRGI